MLFRPFLLLSAVLVLTACAAVVPGYSPPPFKPKGKAWTAASSGEVGEDGHYALGEDELKLDCKRLTGSMQITIARMKDPYFQQEPSAIAGASHKTVGPLLGSTAGADRKAEYARARAKLDAYNRQLAEKNCKTVDIDAELAKAPDPPGKRY